VSNKITNGSFEAGLTGWTLVDLSDPFEAATVVANGYDFDPNFGPTEIKAVATNGNDVFWTGFDGSAGTIKLSQTVTLAANTTDVLTFDYAAGWNLIEDGDSTQNRTFSVDAKGQSGEVTQTVLTVKSQTQNDIDNDPDSTTGGTGIQHASIDLSALAGQTVTLSFLWNVPEDLTGPAAFELDNVVLASTLNVTINIANQPGTPETVITGTGDPGTTLFLYDAVNGNTDFIGSTTVQSDGSWSRTVQLPVGVNQITATDTDAAGNVGTATTSYTLALPPPPHIASFIQTDPASNSQAVVNYTLTFDQPVTGVDASDFSLVTNGLNGSAIASVTAVPGSNGAQYTIAVDSGIGNGTLALELHEGSIAGGFGQPLTLPDATYAAGTHPQEVALTDINNDGKLDAVVEGADGVLELLGNGDGTFQQATPVQNFTDWSIFPIAQNGANAEADLNGDGIPDLILANGLNLSIFAGNADGTFSSQSGAGFNYGNPQPGLVITSDTLSIADVNGDGKPDIILSALGTVDGATTNAIENIVFYASGDGNYISGSSFDPFGGPAVAGDLAGDGKTEIVSANYTTGTISVFSSAQPVLDAPAYNIDTLPTVTSVATSPSSGSAITNETVRITLDMNDSVALVGTAPTLMLNDGGSATYDTMLSTPTALVFDYLVQSTESTSDLQVTQVQNASSFQDIYGDVADLSGAVKDLGLAVNNVPHVQSVTTSPASGTVMPFQTVVITLDMSAPVVSTGGSPALFLNDHAIANYDPTHSTSTQLVFDYQVLPGQTTPDLQVVQVLGAFQDMSGNPADLSGAMTDLKLAVGVMQPPPPPPPLVVSTTSAESGEVTTNQTVSIFVFFNQAVTVAGGTPDLALSDGRTASFDANATMAANNPNMLVFSYVVASDEHTADLTVTGFDSNNATVTGQGGTADLSQFTADLRLAVNTPVATNVTANNPGMGELQPNDQLTLTVTMSEAVTVAGGTPTLALNDGGIASFNATETAALGDPTKLVFDYVVGANDATPDLSITGVDLHGATIRDAAGIDATLDTPSLEAPLGVAVGSASVITAFAGFGKGGPVDLHTGDTTTITIVMNQPVMAGGALTLTLNDGDTATFDPMQSNPTELVFDYDVVSTETVPDLKITAVNIPTGASVLDPLGHEANFAGALTSIGADVAPCYCPGTLIGTEGGEVPVEQLSIGDEVLTASGVSRPIKWIGTRAYAGRFIMGRKDILPVCFKAGSLGDNMPKRDLWISPHHAMYLEGVLI
jgi:large repetitive protein